MDSASTDYFYLEKGAQEILAQLNKDRILDMSFCDFTIKTDSHHFLVHKCLLGAASDYFKRLFASRMMESYKNSVELPTIDSSTMHMVIGFIYNQDVCVNMENIYDLLKAAEYLQISILKNRCVRILMDNISEDSLCKTWQAAEFLNLTELTNVCEKFAFSKSFLILKYKKYLSFEEDMLKMFIKLKKRSTKEEKIFECVIAWVEHDTSRRVHFRNLFQSIDLSRLSEAYLSDVVSINDYVVEESECLRSVLESLRSRLTRQPDDTTLPPSPTTQLHNLQPTVLSRIGKGKGKGLIEGQHNSSFHRHVDPVNYFEHFVKMKADFLNENEFEHIIFILTRDEDKSNKTYVRTYDIVQSKWGELLWTGTNLSEASLVLWKNVLYMIGGYTKDKSSVFATYKSKSCKRLQCVDLNNILLHEHWHEKANLIKSRHGFGCTVYKNAIVVVGGKRNDEVLKSVESYKMSCNKWTKEPGMLCARKDCALVSKGDLLYAIGGSCHASQRCRETIEIFDSHRWRWGPAMNTPRSNFAAVVLKNQIYVIGGQSGPSSYLSHVEKLVDSNWHDARPLHIARAGHCAVVFKGKIYVVGGYNLCGNLWSVEVYDPIAKKWHCNFFSGLLDKCRTSWFCFLSPLLLLLFFLMVLLLVSVIITHI